MPHPEQSFRWSWNLAAPPAALWPLVSNTDRFNRDCGFPAVRLVPPAPGARPNPARRVWARVAGVTIEWDESAFEWVAPERFTVERRYRRGPLDRMIIACFAEALPGGGTRLTYQMRITPAGWLVRLAMPLAVRWRLTAVFERVFREYDRLALAGARSHALGRPKLAPGAVERLDTIARALVSEQRQPSSLVARLQDLITDGDDLNLARIRPYAQAEEWKSDRRETLHLFLHATRAGLLDLSWDLVCPHCRGAKPGRHTLSDLPAIARCDSCDTDFAANFERSVELTFAPTPSVRRVERLEYCVGGPQVTPHVIAQLEIPPGASRTLQLTGQRGRYRIRAKGIAVQPTFRVANGGPSALDVSLGQPAAAEPLVGISGHLTITNPTGASQSAIVEHLSWTDQATTAAEVTALQVFRDLFSQEVLRTGEQISAGTLTIVFTDLKDSTQLYREIGDAPAFGRVLSHFEVLKSAVANEGGAIVKTMGDAVMAVFTRPLPALRAMLAAKRQLANERRPDDPGNPALILKAGIHAGPCLAMNQNERLDYFGSTVNVAARLCGHCSGTDLLISRAVADDPEVADYLATAEAPATRPDAIQLKGFGNTRFEVCRLNPDR